MLYQLLDQKVLLVMNSKNANGHVSWLYQRRITDYDLIFNRKLAASLECLDSSSIFQKLVTKTQKRQNEMT